MEFTQI